MSRTFECKKCEYQDITVSYKDYLSHALHDERCEPYLKCVCRRCGYNWNEKLSDETSSSKDKGL